MPKISKIRIINLTYNDTRHIYDETFDYFEGENALMTLANGGGKTVFVQMAMQPVIPNSGLKTRTFESYFDKTYYPTYIMTEWVLDNNNGKLLTGIGVKKRSRQKRNSNETTEVLQIISFTHEYKEANAYDIDNIQLTQTEKGNLRMIPFETVESTFSNIQKDSEYKFKLFRHSNSEEKAQYTHELNTYKISRDEFEKFIIKINEREHGLTNYFDKSKTAGLLVKNEFLPLIESHLNKGGNTVENIKKLIGKHSVNLVAHEKILQEREVYERFKIKSQEILDTLEQYDAILKSVAQSEVQIRNLYAFLVNELKGLNLKKINLMEELALINEHQKELAYDKASVDYYNDSQTLLKLKQELENIKVEYEQLEAALIAEEKHEKILQCAKRYKRLLELEAQIIEFEAELEKEQIADEELQRKIQDIEFTLKQKYNEQLSEFVTLHAKIQTEINDMNARKRKLSDDKNKASEDLEAVEKVLTRLSQEIAKFHAQEEGLQKRYPDFTLKINPFTCEYPSNEVDKYRESVKRKLNQITEDIKALKEQKESNEIKAQETQGELERTASVLQGYRTRLVQVKRDLEDFATKKEEALKLLQKYEISDSELFNKERVFVALDNEARTFEQALRAFDLQLADLKKELTMYESGRTFELPKDLVSSFKNNGIELEFGFEWLKNYNAPLGIKQELVRNNPFIPYSILLTQREFERIRKLELKVFTSVTLPILERESLEDNFEVVSLNHVYSLGKVHFLMSFNQELLDESHLALLISEINVKIADTEDKRTGANAALQNVNAHRFFFQETFSYTAAQVEELEIATKTLNNRISAYEEETGTLKALMNTLKEANDQLEKRLEIKRKALYQAQQQEQESNELFQIYDAFLGNSKHHAEQLDKQSELKQLIKELNDSVHELDLNVQSAAFKRQTYDKRIKQTRNKLAVYAEADTGEMRSGSIQDLEAQLEAYQKAKGVNIRFLTKSIERASTDHDEVHGEIVKLGIAEPEYMGIEFDNSELEKVLSNITRLRMDKETVHGKKERRASKIESKEEGLNKKKEDINKRFDDREPKDVVLILQTNFNELESALYDEKTMAQSRLNDLADTIGSYDKRIKNMDDYKDLGNDLTVVEPVIVENLDSYRREIIRIYNERKEQRSDKHAQLSNLYALNKQEFASKANIFKELYDDLLNDDRMFLYEHGTNIINRANHQIDWKLEQYRVDFENIQNMEDEIINTACGYIINVYEEMASIDNNSTIEIEGIRKKMLVVELPDRAKLEETLLKQYVKGTISNCVSLIKQGKPHESTLGAEITTDKLIDTLVGLKNIEVKILKIEQNNTKYKKWVEANSISGGEMFVSIFVVFVTLMSYLRGGNALKAFRGNNEGKVLIMDNPFGPISSEHLLVPMFDIAKKYNTQLICLTDIDKHTIRDRFDVIYGMRVEKEQGRNHEYLEVTLEKNESMQEESLAASLFRIEKKQISMF